MQDVCELDSRFAGQLREIALSAGSIESEASFEQVPRGFSISEEQTSFGPSAGIERLEIESRAWDPKLEKIYYDTDLPAASAIASLHANGVPFTSIQKALSVGALGREASRKMVPTRWAITACDTTLGDRLLRDIRQHQVIDTVMVHRFSSLHNHYAVILLPTPWQYEWMEAFLHVTGT
jgi:hypothetical protein